MFLIDGRIATLSFVIQLIRFVKKSCVFPHGYFCFLVQTRGNSVVNVQKYFENGINRFRTISTR